MNAGQLQHALYWVDLEEKYKNTMGSFVVDAERCADDIRADIDAMLQPITAEALTKDGWVLKGWRWWFGGGERLSMYWAPDYKRWEFCVGRIGIVAVASPTNMYDLRELIRIIGGAE